MQIDRYHFRLRWHLLHRFGAIAFAALLVLAGCDSNDPGSQDQLADVAIVPESVTLGVDENVEFSAVGLTASGDTVRDADLNLTWESTDPSVFTVDDGGTATGQEAGTAFCTIATTNRIFVGRDSAFVSVSF